jgi:hypothetical protein
MSEFDMTAAERLQAQKRAVEEADPWMNPRIILSRDERGNLVRRPRVVDTGAKLDDAAYEKLTYTEKKEYAARMNGGK